MAEFAPYQDYFGLNALVVRLNQGSSPWVNNINVEESSDQEAPCSHPPQLQDFDIFKLSKVFNSNRPRRRKPLTHCVFCKNNGESEVVFRSHRLRDEEGTITCPILRAYTCPLCGSRGDNAHTLKYCPSRGQPRKI